MPVEYKDYYKTLGVSKTASAEEIKKAYRKLARQHHPDVNKKPESEKRFKEINEANEVLSDPEKRKRYDTVGPGWARFQNSGGQQRPGGFQWVYTGQPGADPFNGEAGGFSDFFRTLFGEARRTSTPARSSGVRALAAAGPRPAPTSNRTSRSPWPRHTRERNEHSSCACPMGRRAA